MWWRFWIESALSRNNTSRPGGAPAELQAWQARLGFSNAEAAAALSLSPGGFRNQPKGYVTVSPRTARMADLVEHKEKAP